MSDFISRFLKSAWLKNATKYAYNPKRLKAIVFQPGLFLSRKGMSRLKEQVLLMYFYLHDVAIGKYRDYNVDYNYDMSNAGSSPSVKYWSTIAMWQWTSSGRLDGYNGNLD